MTENTFVIKSVRVFFALTICVQLTSSNMVIYRGSKHLEENRDYIAVPKVSCQQIQNAYCSTGELMTCYCYCNWYHYKEWNKCVQSKDIHEKEGCLEYDEMNPLRSPCSSNLLRESNRLKLKKPPGYEVCRVVLNGSHANTQFLDCRGIWNNVTSIQASKTFVSSIGNDNSAIIKLNKTGPGDLAGKMIKVTVKCYNRTKPRHEKVTCALLRIKGQMNCSLHYVRVSSEIVGISNSPQPKSTTPSAANHLTSVHQNITGIIIQYVGYGVALFFGIGFFVTFGLLLQQRKLLRRYKSEKTHSCTKNIYGAPKQEIDDKEIDGKEIDDNEDYDDVSPYQLQPIPKSVPDNDTDYYEEVKHAYDRQKPSNLTGHFNHSEFGYKNWQEILRKTKTSKN